MYFATCEVIVFYAFACLPWTFNVANLFRFIPLFTIQGVSIECYQKWIDLWQLKWCTFDLMLVKPKCVCEAAFLKNFRNKQLKIVHFLKGFLLHLKLILDLPTESHEWSITILKQLFTFDNFQCEHPVNQQLKIGINYRLSKHILA